MVDYTNAAGYVVDSKGRRQFQDRDKVNGIDGTSLIADDRNQDRNSLVDLVEAAGMTPDGSDETQVTQAVQYFGKKAASGMVSGSPGVLAPGDVAGAILYYSGAGNAPAFIYGNQTAFLLTNGALNGYATQKWANGQFLGLNSAAGQKVAGPVTFTGAMGSNAKVVNPPAGPTTGVGGDVANTYWIDTFYARVTALAAETVARIAADNLKANLAGGNTFTDGDQTVTGTSIYNGSTYSRQFIAKETTTGMLVSLKAAKNNTTGDSYAVIGFVDSGAGYHEHQFDYSGSIYSTTKNDSVAWKADLPIGTVTPTNTYSKVGGVITQTFFVVLPSITSGTGYTINLPTSLPTGIQSVAVTVGSDANCPLSTRDWTKGSFTLVPYLTSSTGTKFSITVTGY